MQIRRAADVPSIFREIFNDVKIEKGNLTNGVLVKEVDGEE